MENQLTIFEGQELEILTKEDVSIEFKSEILFNGIQCTEILGYINQNRDIDRHCDEEDVYIITKDNLSTGMVSKLELNTCKLTLGQRGTKFITEDGVLDLIYNSKLPKAKEFKKKVREIVKTIQQTGKFDVVENKLQQIEDSKEREMSLSLYNLEQALKHNPNDMLMVLTYNNKKQELETYKQQVQLNQVTEEVKQLQETLNVVKENTEIIKNQQVYICNRTNFYERVNILANKYFGRDKEEAYKQIYNKMKLLGSFDVFARRKYMWEHINIEREKQGKKPYAKSTLKQKCNFLDVIDKFDKWELCSESYKTIESEFMN